MKKRRKAIEWFNKMFVTPDKNKVGKLRRLHQNSKTGKVSWTKGKKPFRDEDLNCKVIEPAFHIDDNKEKEMRTADFKLPGYASGVLDPFRKNRFHIHFNGIPGWYFNSYKYLGADVHSQKTILSSKKVIKDDYSEFKIILSVGGEIDICDKLVELERNPNIGDIRVGLLDPTGLVIKTILIPNCQVTEIRAFRELGYGSFGDKSDAILYGHIVVKHEQRKFM